MKKWHLGDKDFWVAKNYLNKKINEFAYLEHLDIDTKFKAKDEFKENTANAKKLQEWIDKYLKKEQIDKLRVKLRVEKSRSKKDLQNITIDGEVRARLAKYADSYNVTLSAAIGMLLDIAEKQS